MTAFEKILDWISDWSENLAGFALVVVMLLSGIDIIGRAFGKPVPGSYEIISFAGGLILGFAIPASVIGRVHVIVDLLIAKLPPVSGLVLNLITRLAGAIVLFVTGFALMKMAAKLHAAGEITPVLQLPFYPVAYAMGFAFLFTGIILVFQGLKRGGASNV